MSWCCFVSRFSIRRKYKENCKKYLELEEKFVREAISYVKLNEDKKVVIDTTGSVVYLMDEVLEELRNFSKIIFLETDENTIKQMIKQYLFDPKRWYGVKCQGFYPREL